MREIILINDTNCIIKYAATAEWIGQIFLLVFCSETKGLTTPTVNKKAFDTNEKPQHKQDAKQLSKLEKKIKK